jgi:hypothetical protein
MVWGIFAFEFVAILVVADRRRSSSRTSADFRPALRLSALAPVFLVVVAGAERVVDWIDAPPERGWSFSPSAKLSSPATRSG